jgi:DNA-binding CsgD family transcriptional regulator
MPGCRGQGAGLTLSWEDKILALTGPCGHGHVLAILDSGLVKLPGVSLLRTEVDARTYVQDLEKHLQLALFGGGITDPDGAVLLVRGALAGGDQPKAATLATAIKQLARSEPGDTDMAAAADHSRGLLEQDPLILERAAEDYSAVLARARAMEDAGYAWAEKGNQDDAVDRLRQAHALYEQMGAADRMARVRAELRTAGTRLCHWTHAARPAFGWDSLTETERRIADLVAEGLSNRQVAAQVFLSTHTVAFHLRHVFWKLDVTSRVQLARIAAEQNMSQRDDGREAAR